MAGTRHRDRALAWIAWNQLATPGLGTWLAGRRVTGALQMALAFAGFLIFSAAILGLVREAWEAAASVDAGLPIRLPAWWRLGLLAFGLAWLWSGVTGLALWREARRADAARPPRLE